MAYPKMPQPETVDFVPETLEVVPVDYALAYSALARRVAAVDAYIAAGLNQHSNSIRAEIEEAMLVIKQVETVQLTIKPSSEEL